MRLLFVSTLYSPHSAGGAERVCQNQVEMMAARGHEVAVLTIGPNKGVIIETINGIRVFRVGIRNVYFPFDRRHGAIMRSIWHLLDIYNVGMKKKAIPIVEKWKPDLAICHNIAGWSISLWDAIRLANVPIVQVLHDQYLLCFRSNMFRQERCRSQCVGCRAARRPHRSASDHVDAVVGVSRFILDKMVRHGYFNKSTLRCSIINATDLTPTELTTPTHLNDECVRFGFIGSLTRSKGLEWLLDTFVATAQPSWKLSIAGSGEARYVESLRRRFDRPDVVFLGKVQRSDFFRSIDACIVPSRWEDTLPSVVFEAMLFGVPVIATALGGIPEMVTDGENGMLIDADEPDALANAVAQFAAQKASWKKRGPMIQRDAMALYGDVDRWAGNWDKIFDDTLAAHARSMKKVS